MRLIISALMGSYILISGTPAVATTLMSQKFTCPVGGERFQATVYGSWFGYGGRPDGRPMGTGRGYIDIPECPKNHLVLYRKFSSDERDALTKIIKSPEYRLLVTSESRFYRAAWLERALNPQSPEYIWYLLAATWYVDKDKEKKARYRDQFLSIAEGLPVVPNDLRSMELRLRVLNAYRETGQFDRALRGLQNFSLEEIGRGLPEDVAEVYRLSEQDQARWEFVYEARRLHRLVLREDTSVNPIDVLPDWMAEEECYFRQPKSTFETAFCSKPEMLERLREDKEMFEEEGGLYDYDGPIEAPPPPPSMVKRHKNHLKPS